MMFPIVSNSAIPQLENVITSIESLPTEYGVDLTDFEDVLLWIQTQPTLHQDKLLTPQVFDIEMQNESLFSGSHNESQEKLNVLMFEQHETDSIFESNNHRKPEELLPLDVVEDDSMTVPARIDETEIKITDVAESEIQSSEPETDNKIIKQISFDSEGDETAQAKQNIDNELAPEVEAPHRSETNPTEAPISLNESVETGHSKIANQINKSSQSISRQVVEQTQAHLSVSSTDSDSSFTVRLDPPELGEVLVRLKKSEGGLVMRVAAVEQTTQALLQLNEVELTQSMTEHQSDLTMEFGTESDFHNSEFTQRKDFRNMPKHNREGNRADFNIPTVSTSQINDAHNFTA